MIPYGVAFRRLYLLPLVLSLLTLCSRGQRIDCPELSSNVLSWFPYSTGDTVTLTSSAGDTSVSFPVDTVIISHMNHYYTNLDCGTCNDGVIVNMFDTKVPFHLNIDINRDSITSWFIKVGDSYFSDHSDLSTTNFTVTGHAQYTFGAEIYNNVVLFENSAPQQFKKLLIAKGYGIVGCTDSNDVDWHIGEREISDGADIIATRSSIDCE